MPRLDISSWSKSQQEAILAGGENVLVSAGAGSGKTSVLVERVVRCVTGDEPLDVNRLLVVTFTEAAAAEMKARIAARLQKVAAEASVSRDGLFAKHLERQLTLLDEAQISTLHSFCMAIVRRNFINLGLEPHFSILDEDESLLLCVGLFKELVEEELASDRRTKFQSMVRRFAVGNPRRLMPLVFHLNSFARSQPNPDEWLSHISRQFAIPGVLRLADTSWGRGFYGWLDIQLQTALHLFEEAFALASTASELVSYANQLQQLIAQVQQTLNAFAAGETLDEGSRCLEACLSLAALRVTAKAHPDKEIVQKRRNDAKDILKSVHEVTGRGEEALLSDIHALKDDVQTLAEFVRLFQGRYKLTKRQRGVLDFSDLEHFALEALNNKASGEALFLQDKFVEVFVDEYQDTSPIQDAILAAIVRAHGNEFIVGDVKQSIYRFRMAEPNLFLEKYRAFGNTEPGTVIHLAENYRSRADVVHFVNFLFTQLFSESFGGITYDQATEMAPRANYPDAKNSLQGAVEVHLVERQMPSLPGEEDVDADLSAGDLQVPRDAGIGDGKAVLADTDKDEAEPSLTDLSAMEQESLVIAQRIKELAGLTENGVPAQVWDAKRKTYRPLQFRDIVILLRSARGRTQTILETLEAEGIPAYGVTSTGLFGALEVKWLLAALAIVDNPRREIDLAAVLRSPLAKFSDVELAKIRIYRQGNYFDALRGVARTTDSEKLDPALVAKAASFLRRLNLWRTAARRGTTAAVLERIIAETDFLDYVSGMQRGSLRRANVELLLDKARAFDRDSTDGVFGFVGHAREELEQAVDLGEARTLGENEDVVRVMTIHQSKGLEYPVVFLADLGKQFHGASSDEVFVLHRDLGFGPQFTSDDLRQRWRTVPYIAIEHEEKVQTLAEEARILYVALTRARERLILVGSAKKIDDVIARAAHAFEPDSAQLPSYTRLKAKNYLDWLLPAILRHKDSPSLWKWLAESGSDMNRPAHPDEMAQREGRVDITLWNVEGGRLVPVPAQTRVSTASTTRLDVSDIDAIARLLLQKVSAMGNEHNLVNGGNVGLRDNMAAGADVVMGADSANGHDLAITDAAAQQEFASASEVMQIDRALKRREADGWSHGIPGKISATELRRLWVARNTADAPTPLHHGSAEKLLEDPAFVHRQEVVARLGGTAFHAVMQNLPLPIEPTVSAVEQALAELVTTGRLSEEYRNAIDVNAVVAFLQSSLGNRLLHARQVLREQPFFSRIGLTRESARNFDNNQDLRPHFVIAQGVIDCLAEESDRWLLVDYKTDNVDAIRANVQARQYTAQIAAYLKVAQAVCGDKPVEAYLYFVKPQVSVSVHGVDLAAVFRRDESID